MSETESRLKPSVAVRRRKASDTCHVTVENRETVSNDATSIEDSVNGEPDASAAAEKFGGIRHEIPTNQHAWTEEQFHSQSPERLKLGYVDFTETQRLQMAELLMRHRHL